MYTACYDGIVRQFCLSSGRFVCALADHRPYAVEALQLGPDPTARLVSVDWSCTVACVPMTEPWTSRLARGLTDVEALVYGREPLTLSPEYRRGSNLLALGSSYRLAPAMDPSSRRLLQYRRLGLREEPAEVANAHMTSSVGCVVHDDDRLLLGTADGRVVSLLFRSGL